MNWKTRQIEIYRRDDTHHLSLDCTLSNQDPLISPLLNGFSCAVSRIFLGIPASP
jgi:hypothetical protein